MSIWRLVLGLCWLTLAACLILGRERVVARSVRLRGRTAQPTMLWIVFGAIYGLMGVLWLISAFA